MTTVAERLREARDRRGLTGFDLAVRAKVRPETISRIERGVSTPRVETIEALANALLVNREWLEEGVGAMDPGLLPTGTEAE